MSSDDVPRVIHAGRFRGAWAPRRAGLCSILALACPAVALAQLKLDPYLSTQYEYESNVFSVTDSQQAVAQSGDPTLADSVFRYMGGIEAAYLWSQQKVAAAFEARHVTYEHFNYLNHDEYQFAGKLDWKLASAVDGSVGVTQERRMASFADRNSSQLAMERERVLTAKVGERLTPDWRLEATAVRRDLHSPLPDFSEFSLRENSGVFGIKYLGISRLAAGLEAGYLEGQYEGVTTTAPRFDQRTVQMTANYLVSGLSRLDAGLGYTQRRDLEGDSDKTTALTGRLLYSRQISGKTDVYAQIFRRVNSYTAGATSVVDTGGGVGVNWQATTLIAVGLNYELTHSLFQGQAVPAAGSPDPASPQRSDQFQNIALSINYQPKTWMVIRPYSRYQVRSSNVELDSFEGTVAGVEARLRF